MKLQSFFGLAIASLAFVPIQISATTVASTPKQELAPGGTLKPTMLMAQQSRTYRIRFAPGASGATAKNSVVRGTRDTYIVAAKARQTMRVNISSVEKNAVFDIKSPNGRTLAQERTSWSGTLPATGDYEIIVGGT
ncbi:MAG: hypothetical protein U7123_24955 [Potamolinea sp.]